MNTRRIVSFIMAFIMTFSMFADTALLAMAADDGVYQVTFDLMEEAAEDVTIDVAADGLIPEELVPADDSIMGWTADAESEDFWDFKTDVVTGNMTLYAVHTRAAAPVTDETGEDDSATDSTGSAGVSGLPEEPSVEADNKCGENLTYTFDAVSGTLTINGTGAMYDYNYLWDEAAEKYVATAPWVENSEYIKKIVIDEDVTHIGAYAFATLANVTGDVTIPAGVTMIADGAFKDCTGITSLTFKGTAVPTFGSSGFGENPFKNMTGLKTVCVPEGKAGEYTEYMSYLLDSSVVIAEAEEPQQPAQREVTASGECGTGFTWTLYADGELVINGSGDLMDYGAPWYDYYDSIVTVTLGEGITSIESWYFEMCEAIETVNLPASLSTIGYGAFISLYETATVNFAGTMVQWANVAISAGNISLLVADIHCSDGIRPKEKATVTFETGTDDVKVDPVEVTLGDKLAELPNPVRPGYVIKGWALYETSRMWCWTTQTNRVTEDTTLYAIWDKLLTTDVDLTNETDILKAGKCGKNVEWLLNNDGVLTIRGEGAMEAPTLYLNLPWFELRDQITAIVVENGVTSIFDRAFSGCYNAKTLDIADSVTYIGEGAFSSCSSLTDVIMSEGITALNDRVFEYCSSLEFFEIPESVTVIGDYAFNDCSKLMTVTIPSGVTEIGSSAFKYCYALQEIVIPAGVTAIKDGTFYYCEELTEVTIPRGVTEIGEEAFGNCYALTEITIPASVTAIGSYAFDECTSLNTVHYTGTQAQWDKIVIDDGNNCLKNADFYTAVTVNFDVQGIGTAPQSVLLANGAAIGSLPVIEAEGYTFDGWYYDKEYTQAVTEKDWFSEDTTLYAKWTQNRPEVPDENTTYTVTYVPNSPLDNPHTEEVAAGSKLEKMNGTSGSGTGTMYYYFKGELFKDEAFTQPWDFENDTVNSDITLYEKYYKGYVVNFNYGDYADNAHGFFEQGEAMTYGPLAEKAIEVNGYAVEGWYYDRALTQPVPKDVSTVLTDNLELYAKFVEGHSVVLHWYNYEMNMDYGDILVIPDGGKVPEPVLELPEGYMISDDGWRYTYYVEEHGYYTSAQWIFDEYVVTEKLDLYAYISKGLTITFDANGKNITFDSVIVPQYGRLKSLPTGEIDGYCLTGWYFDSDCTSPVTIERHWFEEDTTLYAKWEKLAATDSDLPTDPDTTYTVTFIPTLNVVEPYTLEFEAGFRFYGWGGGETVDGVFYYSVGELYKDEALTQPWDFENDRVNSDITLYEKYHKGYIVELNYGEYGSYYNNHRQGDHLTYDELARAIVQHNEYAVEGWYYDRAFTQPVPMDVNTEITENFTLYAKLAKGHNVAFIWYSYPENTEKATFILVDDGAKISVPEGIVPDGYTVYDDEWRYSYYNEETGFYESKAWDFENNTVTDILWLYADMYKDAVITFNANGKDYSFEPVTIKGGGRLKSLPTASVDGYCLTGWYFDSDCTRPVTIERNWFEEDTTLYAKWEKLAATDSDLPTDPEGWTVTFVPTFGDRTYYSDITVEDGGKLEEEYGIYISYETDPSAGGSVLVFEGELYKDPQCTQPWDFANDTVTADITLYEKWIPKFILNKVYSENNVYSSTYDAGEQLTFADIAIDHTGEDGYAISGWYYDADLKQKVGRDDIIALDRDVTLYPKYEKGYQVSFSYNMETDDGDAVDKVHDIMVVPGGSSLTEPVIEIPDGYKWLTDWTYADGTGYHIWDFESNTVSGHLSLRNRLIKDDSDIQWTFDDATGTLTFTGTGKIPYFYMNLRPEWEIYKDEITKVVIGEGITSVGGHAFYNYSNITSLEIPQNAAIIFGAFAGCSGLADENGYVTVNGQLCGYYGDAEKVVIPAGITELGAYCFNYNSTAKSVVIPAGVRSIGGYAFGFSETLEEITIPASVKNISEDAFMICDSLRDVWFGGTQEQWNKITVGDGNDGLANATVHFTDYEVYGRCGENATWAFDTETGVLTISGSGAMAGCNADFEMPWNHLKDDIVSAVIAEGITTIDQYAFYDYTKLRAVSIPDSVFHIGACAFHGCRALKEITVPEGMKTILDSAFFGTGIEKVNYKGSKSQWGAVQIYSDNTALTDAAFTYGKYDITVVQPENGTLMVDKTVVTAGETVRFGSTAADGYELEAVYVDGVAVDGFSFTATGDHTVTAVFKEQGPVIVAGGQCAEDIIWQLFSDGELIISGTGAMTDYSQPWSNYADKVTNITVSEGITAIGQSNFADLPMLATVNLPVSLISVGRYSFNFCEDLARVNYAGTMAQWAEIDIADSNLHLLAADIYCADGLRPKIKATITFETGVEGLAVDPVEIQVGKKLTELPNIAREGYVIRGWSKYSDNKYFMWTLETDRVEGDTTLYAAWEKLLTTDADLPSYEGVAKSGKCGEKAKWILGEDGTLTISGTGAMKAPLLHINLPWIDYRSEIKKIVVEDGITSIFDRAFADCWNAQTIEIADSVTHIGKEAFRSCSSVKSIKVPAGVTTLEKGVFSYCSSVETFILHDGITTIKESAFEYCPALKEVTIPLGVTALPAKAFAYCYALEKVTIHDGVTSIGADAFNSCYELTTVNYGGTSAQWGEITVAGGNDYLTNATVNFAKYTITVVQPENGTLKANKTVVNAGESVEFTANANENYSVTGFYVNDKYISSYSGYINYTPAGDTTVTAVIKRLYTITFDTRGIFAQQNPVKTTEGAKIAALPTPKDTLYYDFGGWYKDEACTQPWDYENDRLTSDITLYAKAVTAPPKEMDGGACGENVTWSMYTDGKLYIRGYGPMADISRMGSAPWQEYADSIVYAEIEDGITSIPQYAFTFCTAMTEVYIPYGVTSIGSYAFHGCTALEGILIPESVETMGTGVFFGSSDKLQTAGPVDGSYDIQFAWTEAIPDKAFMGCDTLVHAVLPEGMKAIGTDAFRECINLESITIPASLEKLGEGASYGTSSLKEVFYGGSKAMFLLMDIGALNSFDLDKITYGMYDISVQQPENGTVSVDKERITAGETVLVTVQPDRFYQLKAIYVNGEKLTGTTFTPEDDCTVTAEFAAEGMDIPVTGLMVDHVFSSTAALSWTQHTSGAVIGYEIFRDGESVGTTEECQFIDRTLEPGTKYVYSVKAYTANGEYTEVLEYCSATTALPEITDISVDNKLDKINDKYNSIYIRVKDSGNLGRLNDEEKTTGMLYLQNGDERILLDEMLPVTEQYTFAWDISGYEDGKYTLVFVLTDVDGASDEISKTVEIDRSVPAKIENLFALGQVQKIVLSWGIASEIDTTAYRIYRREGTEGEFTLLKEISSRNTLSYADTTAKEDTQYYYYIVGVNSFGYEGEICDAVMAELSKDKEAPQTTKLTPANLAKIRGNVTFRITAQDNVAVDKAELYYSVDNQSTWTQLTSLAYSNFSYTMDTTALPDGIVYIKGITYDAAGNASNGLVYMYYADNTGPQQVQGLTYESTGVTATLRWENVADEDVAFFRVEQKNSDGTYTTVKDVTSTLGHNFYNLKPDTQYTYRVTAFDQHGNRGVPSEDIVITTLSDTTAPVITDISPKPGSYSSEIALTVTAKDENGVAEITVQTSVNAMSWTDVYTQKFETEEKTQLLRYTLPLDGYEEGYIYVRGIAKDAAGNTSDAGVDAPYVQHKIDKTAPAAPSTVKATGNTGYIEISWKQEDTDVKAYTVYRADSAEGEYEIIAKSVASLNYFDRTISEGVTYFYKVAVTDLAGNVSDMSAAVSAQGALDTELPKIYSISPAAGSTIGPVNAKAGMGISDNTALAQAVIEYSTDGENFMPLYELTDINYHSTIAEAEIPLDKFADGDTVYVRFSATDTTGNSTGYVTVKYVADLSAPEVTKAEALFDTDRVVVSWTGGKESDLAGYKIYRKDSADGEYSLIGQLSAAAEAEYTWKDKNISEEEITYFYKVEAFDKNGNMSFMETEGVHLEERGIPVPVISCDSSMIAGVEYYFDGTKSTDNSGVVSYLFDFGDGTTSTDAKAVHSYEQTGEYTITLTVTDDSGKTATAQKTVSVKAREVLGTVRVRIVDETGIPVPGAPVYFDLDLETEKQVKKYTDGSGYVTFTAPVGRHKIGAIIANNEWLPVAKDVIIVAGEEVQLSMTMVHRPLIEGEFSVTRMTFDEIVAAGIDPYDPANQHIFHVDIKFMYDDIPITIPAIYNPDKDELNIKGTGDDDEYHFPGGGGGGGISLKVIEKDEEEQPTKIAAFTTSASGSFLKEFFDARLIIINNSASEFKMTENVITLIAPSGLTIVDTDGSEGSPVVKIDEIVGGTTETIRWILRGDKEGSYELKADYSGRLSQFGDIITTQFAAKDPVKVYGLSAIKLVAEANKTIYNGAFYFNLAIENTSDIEVYLPSFDLTGTTISEYFLNLEDPDSGVEYTEPVVEHLNTFIENTAGFSQPVGSGDAVEKLAPGERMVHKYAVYNVADRENVLYLKEAVMTAADKCGVKCETLRIDMDLYSMDDIEGKFEQLKEDYKNNVGHMQSMYGYIAEGTFLYAYEAADRSNDLLEQVNEFGYVAAQTVLNLNFGYKKEQIADATRQIVIDLLTDETTNNAISERVLRKEKAVTEAVIDATAQETGMSEQTVRYLKQPENLSKLTDKYRNEGVEGLVFNISDLVFAAEEHGSFDPAAVAGKVVYNTYYTDSITDAMSNVRDVIPHIKAVMDASRKSSEVARDLMKIAATQEETNALLDMLIKHTAGGANDEIHNVLVKTKKQLEDTHKRQVQTFIEEIGKYAASAAVGSVVKTVLTNRFGTSAGLMLAKIKLAFGVIDYVSGWGESVENLIYLKTNLLITKALMAAVGEYGIAGSDTVEEMLSTMKALKYLIKMRMIGERGFEKLARREAKREIIEIIDQITISMDRLGLTNLILGSNDVFVENLPQILGHVKQQIGDRAFRFFASEILERIEREKDNIQSREDLETLIERYTYENQLDMINSYLGTDYVTIDDYMDGTIDTLVRYRDNIFSTYYEDISIPEAPKVTIDYLNYSTAESFSSDYEYSFEGSVWFDAWGEPIKFEPANTTTWLWVRQKGTDKSLASNIAKVAIAAMPLLKGDFSMVYENGSYNVSGLPAGTYQYAFTNRRSMPMFEGSFTVGADGTASVANANPGWTYLAVRTDATENSFASQVRYLTKENAWVADESSRQITTQQEKTSKEELVTYYRNKGLAVLIETAVETVNNLIGTGTTITIMGEEFKAVVHGDLDGDADISTKDLQNATKHVLAEEQLQAEYLDAGCIVGEEETKEMNLFDIYAIINYLETGSFTR